jgi:hypothetical protein
MNKRLIFAFSVTIGFVTVADGGSSQSRERVTVPSQVDHLIFGTPELAAGVATIEKLVGVRATPGGQHPGEGTRNALIALGRDVYLEILGPDPDQAKPDRPRRFGLDDLTAPKLVGWAAKGDDLPQLARAASASGVRLGDVTSGSRRTPQGVLLTWSYTNPRTRLADGIVPFFISWGSTPHPARTAPPGASLVGLRAEHPDADAVQKTLSQLGLDLPVTTGPNAALIATIVGPRGRVELR